MTILRAVVWILPASLAVLYANFVFSQTYSPGTGQTYPNKSIRMLAPEPGSNHEIAGRIVAQGISPSLGQPILVEGRGSASGAIAGEIVAKATPDGYTLLYYGSTIWLLPSLRKNVPFDPVRDFAPVVLVTKGPFLVYVHPSVPVESLKELVAYAKPRPGALNYGSAGSGAASHLSAELFNAVAGVKLARIPYRGSALAANGLVAGEVQVYFGSASSALMQYRAAGKLKVLAVASSQPSPLTPDVPTAAAAGLPGYEAASLSGMFAPAKTPRAIVNRLNQEIVRAIGRAEVKERILNAGLETVGGSPEEFAAVVKEEIAKWGKVIRDGGIREE